MTPILKDPNAVLRYTIAWPSSLLEGAAISAATWNIEPSKPGGVSASGGYVDGAETGARFAGGVPGEIYRVTCHAVLSDGRSADRSLIVRVEQR